jgi:hypothetical protein
MPFSQTDTCSEDQWTWIFEKAFKPAVEGAGLEYECRRSTATRGNLVGSILQDLNDAYVVLADLTDRNANVFYELGVRHSLRDRSILVAQKKEDIPFDLQAYAYHIYDWKSEAGLKNLKERIRQLLMEIDSNPSRPDNPVSDFLRPIYQIRQEPEAVKITPSEIVVAKSVAGPSSEGLNVVDFVQTLANRRRPGDMKTVLRLTRAELLPLLKSQVDLLNKTGNTQSVTQDKIMEKAEDFIKPIDSMIQRVDEFVLASIQEHWEPGIEFAIKLSGDWISISERPLDGHIIRYAQGAPALMAWRMLSLCGAKALEEESFGFLGSVLREPIEVEEAGGRFSNRSFTQRRDLFYPEAFLGYANFPMKYIDGLWSSHSHMHPFFVSNDSYQLSMAKFYIVVSLEASKINKDRPLYPGYKLLNKASSAMSSLCSRMAASPAYLKGIAEAMGETSDNLLATWSERAQLINGLGTGGEYWPGNGVRFPDPMSAGTTD